MEVSDIRKKDIPIEKYCLLLIVFFSTFLNFNSPYWTSCYIALLELLFICLIVKKYDISFISIPKTSEQLSITLFIAFSLISCCFMYASDAVSYNHITFSFTRYFFTIIHILFGCALCKSYFRAGNLNDILMILSISLSLYVAFLLLDFLLNSNAMQSYEMNALPLITNRRYAGYIAMINSIFLLFLLLNTNDNSKKSNMYYYSLLYIVNFSFLIWLGGRGAVFSFLISMILIILAFIYLENVKLKSIIFLFILSTLSSVVSIPFSIFEWNGMHRYLVGFEKSVSLEQFSSGRLSMWADTLTLILQQPFFGYGADAYRFLGPTGHYQPHNFVLQVLLEFGLLGLLFLGTFFYSIVKKSIENLIVNKDQSSLLAVILIISLFVHGLLDGTIYHAQPVMLLAILCAYAFVYNKAKV
ncbi:O-antigen ligase family protein [Vibrio breoganii]|uniref:O-antigen ligase family protein n=1 Tax=Vibrio breoganii TaxID=553239 RepID=UPI000C8293DF|nr:O-antigen ligase family protein [Vibrio breoganii]